MSVFITIEVFPDAAVHGDVIARLCPVDIFQFVDGRLLVNPANEDECTLCELCLKVAPVDAIRIHKTYKAEILVSTGESTE